LDRATIGDCRVGYFRIGVFNDQWDRLLTVLKQLTGSPDFDVTRRRLFIEGSQDSTTGWFESTYFDTTIEMPILPRSASNIAAVVGAYVALDAVGLTADVVNVGDQIKTGDGKYYEVKTVKENSLGDNFSHRECQLRHLPLYEE
jgi:hypothetical protein